MSKDKEKNGAAEGKGPQGRDGGRPSTSGSAPSKAPKAIAKPPKAKHPKPDRPGSGLAAAKDAAAGAPAAAAALPNGKGKPGHGHKRKREDRADAEPKAAGRPEKKEGEKGADGAPPPKKKRNRGGKAPPREVPPPAVAVTTQVEDPKTGKAAPSSNWAAIKSLIAPFKPSKRPPKRTRGPGGVAGATAASDGKGPAPLGASTALTDIVAIDCEMVGVGPGGERSIVARVALVNAEGNVLLDTHVRPSERVTDYRTEVSGVRPEDVKGAPLLPEVQEKVTEIVKGRILVGHALENDLKALLLSHPRKDIRDTSQYPPLMNTAGGRLRPRALRHLAMEQLGLEIQEGAHSPVDDARVALYLYQKHRRQWEGQLKDGKGSLSKLKERLTLKAQGLAKLPSADGLKKSRVGDDSDAAAASAAAAAAVTATIAAPGARLKASVKVDRRAVGITGTDQDVKGIAALGSSAAAPAKGGGRAGNGRGSKKGKASASEQLQMMFPERPDLYDL